MVTKHSEALDSNARDLFVVAMQGMDERWDEAMGLLWESQDAQRLPPHHSIRGSLWYAFGLLMRQRPADTSRAVRVIEAVLTYQLDAPDRVFHGTFLRAPEEPYPPIEAVIWRDYDPNWREFMTTALALVLLEYAEQLPGSLVEQIEGATKKAVAGARARGLSASYTNIALMHAFMLCFAGSRFGEPAWLAEGEQMAREVYRLFKQHEAFAEYNSPTYYGVDLYALALWRSYPELSPLLAQLGTQLEALLWEDLAQFYHADLRNLAGPYDRSYGMDMRRYVAVIGIWLRLVMDKTRAPLPDTDHPCDHGHDLGFVPLITFLGAQVPLPALEHCIAFRGERQIERVVAEAPRRVVTAWLGQDRMLGGELTSLTPPQSTQLYPATLHWRIDSEQIGWVRLLYLEPVDARATKNRLEIATTSQMTFLICAPGARREQIERDNWCLPQLAVRVETSAETLDVETHNGLFAVVYKVAPGQPIGCRLYCESL
jgi:hypothetical protein